jgi:hypothetical protein
MLHYKGLWFQKKEKFLGNIESETQQGIDWITIQELQDSSKETKNRIAKEPDGINMELIKYVDPLFHWRLLYIINQCWLTYKVPES